MAFDDYLRNQKLYRGVADRINANNELQSCFNIAFAQVLRKCNYKNFLEETAPLDAHMNSMVSTYQAALVGTALSSGFKLEGIGEKLLPVYEHVLKQQGLLKDAYATIHELTNTNSAFSNLIKTSVYSSKPPLGNSLPGAYAGVTELKKKMAPIKEIQLSGANTAVKQLEIALKASGEKLNISWLKDESPWRTAIDSITRTEVIKLSDANSVFSKLVMAESQTAKLLENAGINTRITSTVAQLASIIESDSIKTQGIAKLIADYGSFALAQHKGIQKALYAECNDAAKWRLGLLDVFAKFVDRQVVWENDVDATIEESEFAIDIEPHGSNIEEFVNDDKYDSVEAPTLSIFSLIPQEIGYTNRVNSKVETVEGFERSKTFRITELGKNIVDSVRYINQEFEDRGEEDIFKLTKKNTWFLVDLGNKVCDNENSFGELIDNLYFLIYENLEHIKVLIGGGNKKVGDAKVREEDVYQCVFRIKDIRSDLRHDLGHGSEKEIEKKQKRVDDAYKYYAKKRPRKPKEYREFQLNIYSEISVLMADLIKNANALQ